MNTVRSEETAAVSDAEIVIPETSDESSEDTGTVSSDEILMNLTGGFEAEMVQTESAMNTVYAGRTFLSYSLAAPETVKLSVKQASSSDASEETASSAQSKLSIDDISVTYYKTSYRGTAYDDVFLSFEDGSIVIHIPFDISDGETRNAYLSFQSELYDVTLDAPESTYSDASNVVSGNRAMGVDLTQNATLLVQGEHFNQSYPIVIQRTVQDLPVLYLTTDSGDDVTDRYEYVSGNVVIDNSCGRTVSNGSNYAKNHEGTFYENTYKREADAAAADALDGASFSLSIRGRGNASWWKFAQKSYMLKFDDSVSLFGMTSAKKYALVSTYGDPSLIRNSVAMDIATCMDNLEYTTGQLPVDVFLNGTYLGVYTLSEKIDTSPDKVDLFSESSYAGLKLNSVTDIPFLVECGSYVKDSYTNGLDYFYTAHSPQLFVKYPEIEEQYNEEITYISSYMAAADQAITRGYGYEDYIDVDSWVDWFIVMELTNNTDSALCRSTYLYKRADGKLMIGPVWDFDMAFGNFVYDNQTYEYWATAEPIYISAQNHYMSYLYKSDSFMLAVRERWDEKKEELLETALNAVDKYAEQVAGSRIYNNHVRGSGATSYQVDAIRNFIKHRYNWIDMSIHMSDFNRHEATESVPVFETEEIPLLELDENATPDEQAAAEGGGIADAGDTGETGAGTDGATGAGNGEEADAAAGDGNGAADAVAEATGNGAADAGDGNATDTG